MEKSTKFQSEGKMGSRYEKGPGMLGRIDGRDGQTVAEKVNKIAPDFGRFLIGFPFGDIYSGRALI